jgi:hypothetical protein
MTLVGFLYISVGIAWLLLGIPFEGRWETWIQRSILTGIGFVLIVLSTKRKIRR